MKKYIQPNATVFFVEATDVVTMSQYDVNGSDISWGEIWQS